MTYQLKDLAGQRFGDLVVISVSHKNKHGDYYWKCRCDCGTEKIIKADNFKNGDTRSCGCRQLKLTRAGEILVDVIEIKS